MGKLLEQLKNYFENTPADILEKESREWDYLNEIGPDVIEYANIIRGYIGTEIEYNNTPADILEKESKEWDYLNEIGPDVIEYANIIRGYIGTEIEYNSSDDFLNENNYNFTVSTDNINSNAQYGKVA